MTDVPGAPQVLLTKVGNTLYFVATDPTAGRGLWKTQGAPSSTVRLANINSSYSAYITAAGPYVYFVTSAIWRTDGTPAGTVLVKDIAPGSTYSSPAQVTFIDATDPSAADTVIDVYFLYNDPAQGEYKAQFFAPTDFTDAIADATFRYWELDPRGSRCHNGNFYSPLDASLVDWSVVPATATFAGETASGYITEFTVVPEPATLSLLALGGLLAVVRCRRKQPLWKAAGTAGNRPSGCRDNR